MSADLTVENFKNGIANVPNTYTSDNIVLIHLTKSFILASIIFGAIVILFSINIKKRSYFNSNSAKTIIKFIRIYIGTEIILLFFLLYNRIFYGSPILYINAISNFGGKSNDSYIYGLWRPLVGLFLISFGLIGDMHYIPRLLCIFGCLIQVIGDSFSSFQIDDLIFQKMHRNYPTGDYSYNKLLYYYWRDIGSFGLSFCILMLMCYFSILLGWYGKPYISYQNIEGGDIDRSKTMREQRRIRNRSLNDIEKG
jgi:hypothetical protein